MRPADPYAVAKRFAEIVNRATRKVEREQSKLLAPRPEPPATAPPTRTGLPRCVECAAPVGPRAPHRLCGACHKVFSRARRQERDHAFGVRKTLR